MMAAPITSSQNAGVRSPIQLSSGLQIVSYALFSLRNCRGPVGAEPSRATRWFACVFKRRAILISFV
jgi:hypothetical protein